MSRIGKQPVAIPAGVKVNVEGNSIHVHGPKGKLEFKCNPEISVTVDDGKVVVHRASDTRQQKALHGLTRAVLANMVRGVSVGFEKSLEIQGVGYRAAVQGTKLTLALGYSHPIVFEAPAGISISVDKQTLIKVSGIDKQLVGEVAAEIRAFRKPEPYKGKGIRYEGEYVKKKAGKTGA